MKVIRRNLRVLTAIVTPLYGALLVKCAVAIGLSNCFPCENGECVNPGFWCDGNKDCYDGSDEKYCREKSIFVPDPNRCSSLYFKCENGPCIPLVGRCDGYNDCHDSSDESYCTYYNVKTRTSIISSNSQFEGFNAMQFFISLNSSKKSLGVRTFTGLYPSYFTKQRNLARNWLLSQRKSDFGWGEETHRAITALYLSEEQPLIRNSESDLLMIKQLEIQVFLEHIRNATKPEQLTDLALYVNALLVSCKDPKNFYGENLVRALRNKANAAQRKNNFVNPYVYLTLCINNATTNDDTRALHNIFFNRNITIGFIDIQALALMTTACIFQNTKLINVTLYDSYKMEFLRTVKDHGFPGNIYEAALIIQALQVIKVTLVGLTEFIYGQQQANGSFGDVLSTYLVLPILAGKNMGQIANHCEQRNISDLTPIQTLKNIKSRKLHVQYSLNYDFPPEIKQTIQMHVPEKTNFLDFMRLAEEINPKYNFKLGENSEVPIVYSIGEISNDPQKGKYWILYKTSANSSDHREPYNGDIKQLNLSDGDKLLFWYRPMMT